jgi:hypothetical protein
MTCKIIATLPVCLKDWPKTLILLPWPVLASSLLHKNIKGLAINSDFASLACPCKLLTPQKYKRTGHKLDFCFLGLSLQVAYTTKISKDWP